MDQVNVQEAKTHLSRLLQRVEGGETILLARDGRAIARLEPMAAPGERELGFVGGTIPDAVFFDPLPDDESRAWES